MSAVADVYARLRTETAKMLGFDIDALTPVQALRLDLAASLQLEIDRITALQMRGEPADLKAMTSAAELLEKLLHPAEVAQTRNPHEGAREELARFLQGRADAADAEWARQSEAEAEAAADYYRDLARPPVAASVPTPAAPAAAEPRLRVVRNEAPPPVAVPVVASQPSQSSPSERDWAAWYYAGGGSVRQPGWDDIPRNF